MTTRIATAAGAGADTRFFIPFTKMEENSDGSVYVEGIATAEVLDFHGEVVSYEASKAAFEEWSAWAAKATGGESIGNIRVMHQPVVGGKAVKWWGDDATRTIHLGSKIEDPTAAKMCRSRAYTGYSIGGDNVTREMQPYEGKSVPWIMAYRLSENSLVDKPACPESIFTLVKRADHKESPMKLHELFKINRQAVLAVAAAMTDENTIKVGDQTIALDALEKDAAAAGNAAHMALKDFMIQVLGAPGDADLWTLSDILEARRYCYSACLGVQYAIADASMDASGMEMDAKATLKKSETPADPPVEEKPVEEEKVDPEKAPEPIAPVPPVVPGPEKQAAVDLRPVLDAIAKIATSIEPLTKALQEGGLAKAAGGEVMAQLVKDVEAIKTLAADVPAIKKAIESLPAPPAGRAIQKTLGDGSNTQRPDMDAFVKIAQEALAKAAEQGVPKSALEQMGIAFTAEAMKRL